MMSAMQTGTTTFLNAFGMKWSQHQLGIKPMKPFGQCWVPPIAAFYDQQGLLRAYWPPGNSIRIPNPGPPWGSYESI